MKPYPGKAILKVTGILYRLRNFFPENDYDYDYDYEIDLFGHIIKKHNKVHKQ